MARLYAHSTNVPERGFGRTAYMEQLRPLLREKNYTYLITDTPYGGNAALKRRGKTLLVEVEPYIKALPHVQGQPLLAQKWDRNTLEFTPEREAYVMVESNPTDDHFSPYNIKNTLMTSGGLSFIEQTQLECLDKMISVTPPENTGSYIAGNLGYAGLNSMAYQVGCPNRPIVLYKTEAETEAASGSAPKGVALDLFSELKYVLMEQSNSPETHGSKSFAVGSPWAWSRAELGLARQGTPTQKDSDSWWFAGARQIFDDTNRLGSFDYKFAENRLKPHVANDEGSGFAANGTKAWPIVFGYQMAMAHDQEFSFTETDIKDQKKFGSVDRTLWSYDFFPLYPVFLGVAWVTNKEYNLN